jgi:hypothetical protein
MLPWAAAAGLLASGAAFKIIGHSNSDRKSQDEILEEVQTNTIQSYFDLSLRSPPPENIY